MRRAIVFVLSLLITVSLAPAAAAFQLYGGEKRINPAYKSFKYYISSTYYDFNSDGQRPITPIHIEGIAKSLAILTSKAGVDGLAFEYAGTFDYPSVAERNRQSESDDAFDRTIFFDFTSEELWGRSGVPTAGASPKRSPASGGLRAGGVVRFNSDFLNFLHPNGNLSSIVMHETLHILGLDHSTISSSVMAYTEFWYPTLSADDVLALRQIYGTGPDTSITVRPSLSGVPARGVEVVLIDPDTGVTATVVADANGIGTIAHIDPKAYLVAARELTPTGPCFDEPTRGFLTTFAGEGEPTNDPAAARRIEVEVGAPVELDLALIPGIKKFDCHFGRATAISDLGCGSSTISNTANGREVCYMHMARPGVAFELLVENDVSLFHHNTVTDITSPAHARLTVKPAGNEQALTFKSAAIAPDFGNFMRASIEIGANAAPGVQAAYCAADGETALISSFIEVQDFGGGLVNALLLPDLAAEMETYRGNLNYGQMVRPGETPGVGTRPPNVAGTSVGAGNLPGASSTNEPESKTKKKGLCGVAGEGNATSSAALLLMLLTPLLALPAAGARSPKRIVSRRDGEDKDY